jgi:tetratricopeptide (TPR) repeat protein
LWAQILYKTKKFEEAEKKYTVFIQFFPNSQSVEEALIQIGTINSDLQNHEEALTAFQRVIDEFPTSKFRAAVERQIPRLLVAEHQLPNPLDENIIDFTKQGQSNVPTLQPTSPEELQAGRMYRTAIDKLNQKENYEAYQLFSGIIKQFPETEHASHAYEGIANVYNKSENYVNAREYYEKAMYSTTDEKRKRELYDKYQQTFLVPEYSDRRIEVKSSNKLFVKAILLRQEREFQAAARLFETLSNSEISIEDIIYSLYWGGYCYYKAANNDDLFSKSVDLFSKLISDYGDRPEVIKTYYYLALVYLDWGNAVEGDESKYKMVIQTVDEVNRRYTNINYNSDQSWFNRMNELKEKAASKINHEPVQNNTVKYYEQGWAYLEENQYDEAIGEFEKCIEIDPKFKKAYCNLGVIYIKKKSYTKAINELKEAISIDPEFKEAYFNLGLAYLRLGRFDDAKNAANDALQIDPNYEAAKMLRDSIAD